jgi:hypothetical protein
LFGGIIEQGLVRYVLCTHLMLYDHHIILVWTVFYGSVCVCALSASTKCVGSDINATGGVLVWNLVQTSAVLSKVMVLCSSFIALLMLHLRLDSDQWHILSTTLSVISLVNWHWPFILRPSCLALCLAS